MVHSGHVGRAHRWVDWYAERLDELSPRCAMLRMASCASVVASSQRPAGVTQSSHHCPRTARDGAGIVSFICLGQCAIGDQPHEFLGGLVRNIEIGEPVHARQRAPRGTAIVRADCPHGPLGIADQTRRLDPLRGLTDQPGQRRAGHADPLAMVLDPRSDRKIGLCYRIHDSSPSPVRRAHPELPESGDHIGTDAGEGGSGPERVWRTSLSLVG